MHRREDFFNLEHTTTVSILIAVVNPLIGIRFGGQMGGLALYFKLFFTR